MKHNSFTARELTCMALADNKEQIYGLPNVFSGLSEEAAAVLLQETMDALLEKQILTMDFDGQVALAEAYRQIPAFCCGCRSCLTVSIHKPDAPFVTRIFWRVEDSCLMAEACGDSYVLSTLKADTVRAYIPWSTITPAPSDPASSASIPQLVLEKAKRAYQEGKTQEALRTLRQHGADEKIACIIADGLVARADMLGLLLIDNRKSDDKITEKAFLSSRGITLEMGTSVHNFRTCSDFTEKSNDHVRKEITALADAFCGAEGGCGA